MFLKNWWVLMMPVIAFRDTLRNAFRFDRQIHDDKIDLLGGCGATPRQQSDLPKEVSGVKHFDDETIERMLKKFLSINWLARLHVAIKIGLFKDGDDPMMGLTICESICKRAIDRGIFDSLESSIDEVGRIAQGSRRDACATGGSRRDACATGRGGRRDACATKEKG